MTDLDDLSTRIRACAEKHGVWDDVVEEVERIRGNAQYWDWYFESYGAGALAISDNGMMHCYPPNNLSGSGLFA